MRELNRDPFIQKRLKRPIQEYFPFPEGQLERAEESSRAKQVMNHRGSNSAVSNLSFRQQAAKKAKGEESVAK